MKENNGDWAIWANEFTKDQEEAIWQFFIDHGHIEKSGIYTVRFPIRDMNDFFRRVFSRKTGDYKKYKREEREMRMEKVKIQYQEYLNWVKKNELRSVEVQKIKSSNNIAKRVALMVLEKINEVLFFTSFR